jgi:hypothetical protein
MKCYKIIIQGYDDECGVMLPIMNLGLASIKKVILFVDMRRNR